MSDSGGSSPTFSQPTSATTGLQGYDLKRRRLRRHLKGRLAADTKRRALTWHRRGASARGALTKDGEPRMDQEQITAMVGALHASVTGILGAPAEERAAKLEKTFEEFGAELGPALEKYTEDFAEEVLAKAAPEEIEEPLFKGLGAVGAVGNLLSSVNRQVIAIKEGQSERYYDGPSGGRMERDEASEDVSALLDSSVHMITLALRAAVNEHVELVDPEEEEEEEGLSYVQVPNAESPDDEDAAVIMKTALPEGLAKFATDPASIHMASVELGASLMLDGGVSPEALEKAFGLDDEMLQKADGDPLSPVDVGEPVEEGDVGQEDPADMGAQLEIAGRIGAAMLMQLEHLTQLYERATGNDVEGMGDDLSAGGAADGQSEGADDVDEAVDETEEDVEEAEEEMEEDTPQPEPETPEAAAAADAAWKAKKKAKEEEEAERKRRFGKSADGDTRQVLEKAATEITDLRKQLALKEEQLTDTYQTNMAAAATIDRLSKMPAPAKGVLQAQPMSKAQDSTDKGGGADETLTKLAKEYSGARGEHAKQTVLMKAQFKLPGTTQDDLEELAKSL